MMRHVALIELFGDKVFSTMLPVESIPALAKFVYGHPRTWRILPAVVSCFVAKVILSRWWARQDYRNKRNKRKIKAEERKATVVRKCIQEHEPMIDVFSQSVQELGDALRNGTVSVVAVLHAFQKKALELTKKINCVTEPIVEAEELARSLDASPAKKGLLFGLPVSLKENIKIAGYDSTAGMTLYIDKIAKEDAVIVQAIKKHGAVPFARTNIPQTMLSYCCSNPLYGETIHPQDKTRTPGGSSGGEGAIIGGGGSIMGIGTDIGGSVRVPAYFCGIYSLKTTKGRISTKGVLSLSRGNVAIQGVLGPMARDLDSLVLLSRAMMSQEMFDLDPSVPKLPFNFQDFESTSPLRIGYYTYDGNCQCQPPVVRAVMEAKKALERMGHAVVPFNFSTNPETAYKPGDHFIRIMMSDRGERLKKMLENDETEPVMKAVIMQGKLPRKLLEVLAFLLSKKDKFSAKTIRAAIGHESMVEHLDSVSQFLDWQDNFMAMWTSQGLDAVICPVFPSPAVTRDVIPKVTVCGLYCHMYNALNYPSGVMPVIKVSKEDVADTLNPQLFQTQSVLENLLLKSIEGSEGLSVGVQCVALPFREETCLRVMKDLEHGLHKNG